jgi:glycolate oxidase FAD binding subunit
MGADAVAGVEPKSIKTPTSTEELSEILIGAAREKLCVSLTGGGTKLGLGNPPEQLDLLVRTRGMKKILEYAPADMVLIAEAGATLAEIQSVAREHRQMLALDPPFFEQATIGGVIATADCGPRRMRYDAIKDLIIGATLIRADGAIAKSGGKVVKNVAGFDLPKLACGSLGTLFAVATATFRLHPLPEAIATTLSGPLTAAEIPASVLKIRDGQLEPTSALVLRQGSSWQLALRFEGFHAGVRDQCTRLAQLMPAETLSESAASRLWARHSAIREQGAVRLKVSYLPSAQFADLAPKLLALGNDWVFYPSVGLGYLSAVSLDVAALEVARAALLKAGSLTVLQAPETPGLERWGALPSGFAIMKNVKNSFDPERRLNRGRFVGGL